MNAFASKRSQTEGSSEMSFCEHCGGALMGTQRSTRRFCSDKCRAANYRRDKTALARHVLNVIGRDLDARVAFAGFMAPASWQDAIRLVELYHPAAWSHFGPEVVRAAAQPLPQGTCRSCMAIMDARVHNREATVARVLQTAPGRLLVGGGCSRCKQALSKLDSRCRHCATREQLAKMADSRARLGEFTRIITKAGDACRTCREVALRVLDAKVHPRSRTISGSTSAASGSSSAPASPLVTLLSHGPPTSHDPFRSCVLCRLIRANRPDAMTASVAPNDFISHRAWLGTSAEARDYVHKHVWPVPGWLQRVL
jgi:hypothetical protein